MSLKLIKSGLLIAATFAAGVANADLIAHWNFDETSGDTVTDVTGNGYNGTLYNVSRVPGIYGNALAFDSNLDQVVMDNSNSLAMAGDNTYSVSVWVNGVTAQGSACCSSIAGFRNDAGWVLRADNRDTKGVEFLQIANGGYYGDGGNVGFAPGAGWHLLTSVVDTNTVRLYMDNSLVDSYSFSGTTTINGSGNLMMGAVADGYLSGGMVDDLRIYNNALSAEEINALYTGEVAEVPEPSSLAIFALTILGLASRRLKK